MAVLSSIVSVLVFVFLVSAVVGLFLAVRDIRKNKNTDCSFRKSRKERIKETLSDDSDNSVLDSINNLTPDQQELFRSELLKKFDSFKRGDL